MLSYRIASQAMQKILLGDIDQIEIYRKGANDLIDGGRAEIFDQLHQVLAPGFAIAFAQLNKTGAQGFHRVKHFGTFMLEQYVSDQFPQQLDA